MPTERSHDSSGAIFEALVLAAVAALLPAAGFANGGGDGGIVVVLMVLLLWWWWWDGFVEFSSPVLPCVERLEVCHNSHSASKE